MDNDISLPNKKSLHGRSIKDDQSRLYSDLNLDCAIAVLEHVQNVQSPTMLSNILSIPLVEAVDILDCLLNIGIIENSPNGYQLVEGSKLYLLNKTDNSKETRSRLHSFKLLQIAEKLKSTDHFSDKFSVASTSYENIIQFHEDIQKAYERFNERNSKLKPNEKNYLLTSALGFIFGKIKANGKGE